MQVLCKYCKDGRRGIEYPSGEILCYDHAFLMGYISGKTHRMYKETTRVTRRSERTDQHTAICTRFGCSDMLSHS